MSIRSHQLAPSLRSKIGRPPPTRSAQCDAMVLQGWRCSNFATWLLPEMDRCQHHVPADLIPALQARADAWTAQSEVLWDSIRRAFPA